MTHVDVLYHIMYMYITLSSSKLVCFQNWTVIHCINYLSKNYYYVTFKSSKVGYFVSFEIGNITLHQLSNIGHLVSSETRSTLPYLCFVHSHCKFLTFLYRPLIIHRSRSSSITIIRAAPARYIHLILAYNTHHVQ